LISKLLSAIVITLGVIIGLHWFESLGQASEGGLKADIGERNERSTPREFILPATPAVAFDQELRDLDGSSEALRDRRLAMCASRLTAMGYDIGDELVAFNAKLAESIFLFQEGHGLAGTGKLNTKTAETLRC
jgi:hypothetical protein